jgi:hypothetical protein
VKILDVLGFHRRSGTFQVLDEDDAYGIHIQAGRVIYATSSHRTLRLGHLLLQSGAVEPTYLHDILKGRRTSARDRALGGALVRDGALSLEDLAEGIEEQAIELLSRVISLQRATYLHHGDDAPPAGIVIVPLDSKRIAAEATERFLCRAATRVMQRLLPPQDVLLFLMVKLALVAYALSDAEWLVALHVDRAGMTPKKLGETLPLDPPTLKRTVISLLERGVIVRGEAGLRFES